MAAVASLGRATAVEAPPAPAEAEVTQDLYERYSARIFGYCLHRLGSREEAEDAVQTTFLNAFRGLRRGVVPQLESAWLYKIADNVCLSTHRSASRRRRVESPGDLDTLGEVIPAPQRHRDELHRLEEALGAMPEQQRRAILLREWQGLSYREIAAELDVSQSAVETLIFRARRSLAQGLEQPDRPRRLRVRHGANAGSVLATLKSLLVGGSVAVKVAAAVAVVTTATIMAGPPLERHALGHARPAGGAAVPGPAPTAGAPQDQFFTGVVGRRPAAVARAQARRTADAHSPDAGGTPRRRPFRDEETAVPPAPAPAPAPPAASSTPVPTPSAPSSSTVTQLVPPAVPIPAPPQQTPPAPGAAPPLPQPPVDLAVPSAPPVQGAPQQPSDKPHGKADGTNGPPAKAAGAPPTEAHGLPQALPGKPKGR